MFCRFWRVVLGIFVAGLRVLAQDNALDDPLKVQALKLKDQVVELRGLSFKSEVKVGVYSKEELLDFLREEMEREFPREKAQKYQLAYAHFRLIPKDLNLYDALLDLYGSSIAGFYHPKTKEMRLIRAGKDKGLDLQEKLMEQMLGISLEDITLVHELTHAAQDQNFDLESLPMEDETNDDMVMAIKGMVEGDASIVGWQYGFKDKLDAFIGQVNGGYKTGMLPGKAGTLPAFLRHTLTFPYGYGTDFVLAVKRHYDDDWKAISKMFDDPPSSTEQILHPEKYFQDRDDPIVITLPAGLDRRLGRGWGETLNNVHGEFVVRILMAAPYFGVDSKGKIVTERIFSGTDAKRIAEGWDGDRFAVYRNEKGGVASVWYTVWDDPEEAREFYKSYDRWFRGKYADEDQSPQKRKKKIVFETGPDTVASIERRGNDVLILDGVPQATQKVLSSAVWKGSQKIELKRIERVRKPGDAEGRNERKRKEYAPR